MGLFGVNFWSRYFWGFVGSPSYLFIYLILLFFFFGLFDHPCHVKSEVPLPGSPYVEFIPTPPMFSSNASFCM